MSRRAFTTVEALVAVAIAAGALLAVYQLIAGGVHRTAFQVDRARARLELMDALDQLAADPAAPLPAGVQATRDPDFGGHAGLSRVTLTRELAPGVAVRAVRLLRERERRLRG